MEVSGSTYPTLLQNLGSFSQQGSCQLQRNLQDSSSFNSFSDNVNADFPVLTMNTLTLPLDHENQNTKLQC